MLALFLSILGINDFQIRNTELYQPLESRHVVLTQNGHTYFIHHDEKHIAHYDETGKALANIGGPGNGPGEFLTPFDIFFDNGLLYVQDFWLHRIVCFDASGNFIENLNQPSPGLRVLKVNNGWVYIKFGNPRTGSPNLLVITGERFSNPVTLIKWENSSAFSISDFSPVRDICQLAKSSDGKLVYFYKPGQFEIFKIDVSKKSISTFIKRALPALPFDNEWGTEEFKKQGDSKNNRPQLKPAFPETFPLISNLAISPWNTLWVTRGNRPDLEREMVFNLDGQEISGRTLTFPPKQILAFNKEHVLIYSISNDGSFGINSLSIESMISNNTKVQ